MSLQIPVSFIDHFLANILVLSQQKQPMLRACCRMEDITGDTMYVERIGPKDAVRNTTRHGDTPYSDAEHTRRKLSMEDWDVPADLIDKPDKLKLLIEPESVYAQNQTFSLNRVQDDVVIIALGAAAYGGHTGGTTVNNYDVGECRLIAGDGTIVTAGSNHSNTTATALTIAKLLTCKQLLEDAEIDPDRQRYFVANPYNINQFINLTEVKSSEYNNTKALADGRLDINFAGFKFIPSTRLATGGTETDCKACYAFVQDAIVLAVAREPTVDVTPLPTKRNAIQVYSTLSIGATRVEGPAVVEINLLAA